MSNFEAVAKLPINLIVHADWSINPQRRWQVRITRAGNRWRVDAPTLVGDLSTFLDSILPEADGGQAMLGLDLPIGAPSFWAEKAGVPTFLPFLKAIGTPPWTEFYEPAPSADLIKPHRPFYPAKPGGTKQAHLFSALGGASMDDLCRRVEFNADGKRAATPLFWTLGAAQVGKAALSFWEHVLQPALKGPAPPAVWPFDGPLVKLTQSHRLTITETYPAEIYEWFDLQIRSPKKSKTSQTDRAADANQIFVAGEKLQVDFSSAAAVAIKDGFPMGDDAFDAMVGALGMFQVAQGKRAPGTPDDPKVHAIEGWILGRRAGPTAKV